MKAAARMAPPIRSAARSEIALEPVSSNPPIALTRTVATPAAISRPVRSRPENSRMEPVSGRPDNA